MTNRVGPGGLTICGKCSRANGPERPKCLYCGAELRESVPGVAARLDLRKLEDWENGWNVILLRAESPDRATEAARILSFDGEVFQAIIAQRSLLPIARLATEEDASVIKGRLAELGFAAAVMSDQKLDCAHPPVRLRGLDLGGNNIVLKPFSGGASFKLPIDRLSLIVLGTIIETRAETVEKRKKRSNKTISESHSNTDEIVIDIYAKDDPNGWRIQFGFDFSCLGDERTMFAAENLQRLAQRLAQCAPDARFVNDYKSCQRLLDAVWEPECRKESLGVQRTGLGRVEMNSVTVVSNMRQFTKYSRLQWQLL